MTTPCMYFFVKAGYSVTTALLDRPTLHTFHFNSGKYTTYTHNNHKFGHSIFTFFRSPVGSWKNKHFDEFSSLWLRNLHFYPRCAPRGSVGPANKTSPRATSAAFQGISTLRNAPIDAPIVLSKRPPELPHIVQQQTPIKSHN